MARRTTIAVVILGLFLASNAHAIQIIIPGLYGSTNEVPIAVPTVNAAGMATGTFTTGRRNTSLLYVNCRTGIAVARVYTRGVANATGNSGFLINDATVNAAVGNSVTNFINAACGTALTAGQIAGNVTHSLAVYARPGRRGNSRVALTALWR